MKNNKVCSLLVGLLTTAALLLPQPLWANQAEEGKGKGLDVTGMIFEHIQDSYYWHLTDWNETPIAFPLPVIVYSQNSGLHVFMSSKFHHGHEAYEGLYLAKEGSDHAGKIVEINSAGEEVRPTLDMSITKNVAGLLLTSTIFVWVVIGCARWYKRKDVETEVPKGSVGMVEMLVDYVYSEIIKPNISEHRERYTPYLLTVFFFIFFNNLCGLIPGSANITGNIAVTVTLALFTFVITNVFGTKGYWEEVFWNKQLPMWLRPIMAVIEFIGLFTKPFSLTIRLFANITAGHCAILGVLSVIFITAISMPGSGNAIMSGISLLLTLFLNCLELLVAFIQAFVFTMLSAIYIGMSQVHEHEE